MPRGISGLTRVIYHLLCGSFGQCISISEIINFDVFDIVTVGYIHVSIDVASAGSGSFGWGRGSSSSRACGLISDQRLALLRHCLTYRSNGGYVDMLNAFLSLDRSIDTSCSCGYEDYQ